MGLKPKNQDHATFYECCDLTKKVYLTIHSITIHNTTLIVLALLFSVLCLMYFLCSRYATQILFICVLGENVCIPLKKIVL